MPDVSCVSCTTNKLSFEIPKVLLLTVKIVFAVHRCTIAVCL